MGATNYINPASGQDIINPAEFSRRGISLHFAQAAEFVYDTARYQYESNLSIIDVLMWNSPEVVIKAVSNSVIIENGKSGDEKIDSVHLRQ